MTDFALYAIRRGPHGYTLAKFDTDLNFLAEYNTDAKYCSCPAGPRPTCRHRKMLPRMLGKVDTNEFYCYELQKWYSPLSEELKRDMDYKLKPLSPEQAELETDLSDKKTVVIDEASSVTQEMWDSVLNSEFKPFAASSGKKGEAKAKVETDLPTTEPPIIAKHIELDDSADVAEEFSKLIAGTVTGRIESDGKHIEEVPRAAPTPTGIRRR